MLIDLPLISLAKSLRELDIDPVRRHAENLVREAFMRRQIERALAKGVRRKDRCRGWSLSRTCAQRFSAGHDR